MLLTHKVITASNRWNWRRKTTANCICSVAICPTWIKKIIIIIIKNRKLCLLSSSMSELFFFFFFFFIANFVCSVAACPMWVFFKKCRSSQHKAMYTDMLFVTVALFNADNWSAPNAAKKSQCCLFLTNSVRSSEFWMVITSAGFQAFLSDYVIMTEFRVLSCRRTMALKGIRCFLSFRFPHKISPDAVKLSTVVT